MSWSKGYKKSINCSNPKGFSQKAHCAGRTARKRGEKTQSKSVSEMKVSQLKEQIRRIIRMKMFNEARGGRIPKLFLKIEAVKKEIDRLTSERKSKFGGEYAKKLNAEKDLKKREQLKQPILVISKKITELQKNLLNLYDMEERYIQNLDKDAELELEIKEAITNPKKTNPSDLAKMVLGWFDFTTDYIDDGGERRRAIKSNDDVLVWFGSHPKDVKEKAYKILLSRTKSEKGQIERTFGKHLKESVNEGLYHVGYNKGRGQGTGVFKDSYSSYKDAKKAVEKLEKERGGSYNTIAYYVSDKDGKFVKESVNESENFNGYVSSSDGKTFTLYNSDKKKIKDVSFDDLKNKYMKTYLGQKLKDFKDSFDKTTSKGKYFQWWKGKLVNVQLSGIDESVNEGKKAFKVNPGIGKAKYSISSHDGKKKHNDGSDFWDIEIFKNKIDLEKGIKKYTSNGFVKESVNESTEPEVISQLKDIVKNKQYKMIKDPKTSKSMGVDMQTANAVLQIYNGLSNVNKDNMVKMGLPKMIEVSFKIINKYKK